MCSRFTIIKLNIFKINIDENLNSIKLFFLFAINPFPKNLILKEENNYKIKNKKTYKIKSYYIK